ncbi:MAG TPA: UDP-N-acetylmuramoyl-tripeptide--D-alanyl-D-alanine ligase [Vicinamibacteria bacterium]
MLPTAMTLAAAATAMGARLEGVSTLAPFAGVSIDSRTLRPGELFFAIAGPRLDGHDYVADAARRGAVAAVVHRALEAPPGLPLLRVAETTRALAELARAVRAVTAARVVAITGSVGKTTTKDMTAALLARRGPVLKTEGNLNNQYGLPLTLMRLRPDHHFAVLELGMSAAGELRALSALARPEVAVITLVAPVHLEFFDSVEAIAAAKAEILEGLTPDGVAVLNGDDPHQRRIGVAHRGPVLWFGHDRAFEVSAEGWRGTVNGMRFDLRLGGEVRDVALPLAGPHFLTNFLAAAAVAHHLGLTADEIAAGALELRPARHRGEVVRLGQGITLIDDCYNSNPVAVEAAVTALGLAAPGRRVAVLGDMRELGPTGPERHRQTGQAVGAKLGLLVAVGELADHLLEGARHAGLDATALHAFADAAAAAAALPDLLQPGDAVLVKGSRGVKLEVVVDAVVARFGRAEAQG